MGHKLQLWLSSVTRVNGRCINKGPGLQVLTSSLGPSPTSATWLKMRCSSSRLKSASFVPKILASTYCKAVGQTSRRQRHK